MAGLEPNDIKLAVNDGETLKDEGLPEYNPFKNPADLKLARKHGKAKMVYKKVVIPKDQNGKEIRKTDSKKDLCPCCGLPADGEKIAITADLKELYHLGTGLALYFKFIKYSIAILVFLMLVTGIYNLVSNVTAGDCAPEDVGSEAYCFRGYILSFTIPNKKERPDHLFAQIAVNFASVILVMFFFQYLRYQFRKTEIEAENMNITPSDYTIVLNGVPPEANKDDITNWLEGFGTATVPVKVVRVIKPVAITEYIELKNQMTGLSTQHAELIKKGSGMTEAEKKKAQKIDTQARKINRQLEAIMQTMNNKPQHTSVAYVTFETAEQSDHVQKKFKKSLLGTILRVFVSRLRILDTKDKFKGRTVEVKRAPEPTDIIWANLGASKSQRGMKKFITNFATLVLILITFGIIILINWGQDKAIDAFGKKSVVVQILSFVGSIVIVISNTVLAMTIEYLTGFEKHQTHTHFLQGVAQKLAIAQFVNTALTTLFAELILSDAKENENRLQAINFYGKGGLLESIYWVFITNAFLTPILTIFDFSYFYKVFRRFWLKKTNDTVPITQKEAHTLYEGSAMGLPAKYATIIKVMLMTCFYAPAMPFALIYAAIGLFLSYWADKYILLRRHALPNSLDDSLTDSMVEYLEWASFTFSVGNIVYVFTLKDSHGEIAFPLSTTPLVWIAFGISLFHIMFPMELLNQTLFPITDLVTETKTFEEARNDFITDYDRTNPITKEQALKQHLRRTNQDTVKDTENDQAPDEGINFGALDEYAKHVEHHIVGEKPSGAPNMGGFFDNFNTASPDVANQFLDNFLSDFQKETNEGQLKYMQPNQEVATPEKSSLIPLPWQGAGSKAQLPESDKEYSREKEHQPIDLAALNFVMPHFQRDLDDEKQSNHGLNNSGDVDPQDCLEEAEPTAREFAVNRMVFAQR